MLWVLWGLLNRACEFASDRTAPQRITQPEWAAIANFGFDQLVLDSVLAPSSVIHNFKRTFAKHFPVIYVLCFCSGCCYTAFLGCRPAQMAAAQNRPALMQPALPAGQQPQPVMSILYKFVCRQGSPASLAFTDICLF
jgi:hypothetical protein